MPLLCAGVSVKVPTYMSVASRGGSADAPSGAAKELPQNRNATKASPRICLTLLNVILNGCIDRGAIILRRKSHVQFRIARPALGRGPVAQSCTRPERKHCRRICLLTLDHDM